MEYWNVTNAHKKYTRIYAELFEFDFVNNNKYFFHGY